MRRDLIALPDNSKVWIYQAKEPFSAAAAQGLKQDLYDFTMQWASHGHQVDSYGHLFHSRFLVLVADGNNLPSGCSIDSSVHLIQELGNKYATDLLDRTTVCYLDEMEVKTVDLQSLSTAYAEGNITRDTLVFDNLVANKADFLSKWIIPIKESWHQRFI